MVDETGWWMKRVVTADVTDVSVGGECCLQQLSTTVWGVVVYNVYRTRAA